jgi:hypothetical protein
MTIHHTDLLMQSSFVKLVDEHFNNPIDVFLKDTPVFWYSEKLTIDHLTMAPCLIMIKAQSKLWEVVPIKVKQYRQRVLEAFPATKGKFNMLNELLV